jgi:hypothetical protein
LQKRTRGKGNKRRKRKGKKKNKQTYLQGSTTAMGKELKISIRDLHAMQVQMLERRISFDKLLDPGTSITTPVVYQQIKLHCSGLALELETLQVLESLGQCRGSYGVAIGH